MDSNGDFSSTLVQEVVASLGNQPVPDRYIHKNGLIQAEATMAPELLIDFSRLSEEDELRKLRSYLSDWGYFQIVNHGLEKELMEKFLEVTRQFFALPLEEKKKCFGAAGQFSGYGNDAPLWGNRPQNWHDRFYLKVGSKDPADDRFMPENPPDFSKVAHEFVDKINAMPETLIKAMARSLGLQEDCFLSHHGLDGVFSVKLSYYPLCPNPDKILGFPEHTDGTTFTLVLQDNVGLEVMINDRWFKVPVVPGALFVNIGDLLEIMSNGTIEGTMHRVSTDSENKRYSVSMFYTPSPFKELEPVEELVTTDRPRLYKKISMMKLIDVYKDWNPKEMRPILAFRL